MNEPLPPAASPTSPSKPGPAGTPAPPQRRWLLYGCGALLGLVLIIVATVAITFWYIQRPIRPVVLSQEEKAVVEAKLKQVNEAPPLESAVGGANIVPARPSNLPAGPATATAEGKVLEPDRPYQPGSKVLRLTERELNGLLNANTDLGGSVRFELGRDAINAYVAAPIPEDVPVMGGKMFRARGRFRIALGSNSPPVAVLEDVTVFGLSLPKEWLGGIKGENLLGEAMGGKPGGGPALRGIKSLRVEPGALVLEVNE